jgi:hypothetical protein
MRLRNVLFVFALLALATVAMAQEESPDGAVPATPAPVPSEPMPEDPLNACVACHSDVDLFDVEGVQQVNDFLSSVHNEVGITCADCHGGNDDPALAEDLDLSMDPAHAENPYFGVPERHNIPAFCGKCHSDLAYMRRFNPGARVDQETEYWTSGHGIAMKAGDTSVATCTDCHGGHNIKRAEVPESRVYPKNVAATCGGCHSDAERMAGYELPDGRPLRTDQEALWARSVHARSMLEREDLTAPTCNDCHGNHGAMPPGLDSITFVCGQCHGREASMFRESAKQDLWEAHNENLEMAGFESCPACHEPPDPQAAIDDMYHFGECTSCHGNHGIVRPTLAFFAPFERTPCAFCHEGLGEEGEAVEIAGRPELYQETLDDLLREAEAAGMTQANDEFNFLIDKSIELHTHVGEGGEHGGGTFARLFEKFRFGKTYYEYTPTEGGESVRVELQRCTWCHTPEPTMVDFSEGHRVGREMARQAVSLMAATTRAETSMARARRGGIELRDAMLEVDRAVDKSIDLQVLVHRFRTDGEFAEAHAEGMAHAAAALAAGEEAQAELRFRRLGLLVFLVFIVCVLIGLAMKIREV